MRESKEITLCELVKIFLRNILVSFFSYVYGVMYKGAFYKVIPKSKVTDVIIIILLYICR